LNSDRQRRLVTVANLTRGTLLGDRIDVADTSLSRFLGLIPKRGLNAGEGLWIKPSSGVHMFWMRFAIDVIGLDKQMRVVKIWRNLKPWRMTSVSTKMHSALELPVGQIDAGEVQLGDVLEIQ
jgi:uncharacterized membrane protein (UPF0127 family)